MDEKTWLYPLAYMGFASLIFLLIGGIIKFESLLRDNKNFKEDIKKLQDEVIELKYSRKE